MILVSIQAYSIEVDVVLLRSCSGAFEDVLFISKPPALLQVLGRLKEEEDEWLTLLQIDTEVARGPCKATSLHTGPSTGFHGNFLEITSFRLSFQKLGGLM